MRSRPPHLFVDFIRDLLLEVVKESVQGMHFALVIVDCRLSFFFKGIEDILLD